MQAESSRSAQKRRAVQVSDDEDSYEPSSQRATRSQAKRPRRDEDAGRASPQPARSARKRVAVIEDSDSEGSNLNGEDEDEEEEEDGEEGGDEEDDVQMGGSQPAFTQNHTGAARRQMERAADGYVPGAVTRIRVTNFMTYDNVEFHPGPYLNMILGPNGTGKSTIAAAIAIGLGFPPKVMGRAHDLKSYVKQGAEKAETEIELKAKNGKPNIVIFRRFTRESDSSTWLLDGHSATKKQVSDIVRGFGVQASNLCSFLPQDKVADFAKMNPVTVLRQTMLAAGDRHLATWHEGLIKSGEVLKQADAALATDRQKRDTLEHQVADLEPDVRHFEARQDLEFDRDVTQCCIVAAHCYSHEVKMRKAKKRNAHLKAKLVEFQKQQAPLAELQEFETRKQDKAKARTRLREDNLMEIDRDIKHAKEKARTAERSGADIESQLRQIGDQVKKREEQIRKLEEQIERCRAVLDEPQANVHEEIKAKLEEKKTMTAKLRPLEVQRDRLADQCRDLQAQANDINDQITQREQRQRELSSIETQRRQAAFRFDPSIRYATDWIEKNEMKLKAKIHLPVMISANVSDKRYAWQVEACTNMSQRKTFICQDEDDYRLLMDLNGRQFEATPGVMDQVKLHIVKVNVTNETVNPNRPCPPEVLEGLGFEGFAIDYVEAEPAVLAFLCQSAGLHRAALTQNAGDRIDSERVANSGIPQWHTRTDSNRAIRSKYGSRAVQIVTTAPSPARAFNLSVDTEAIAKLTDEAADLKRKKQSLEQPIRQLKDDQDKCSADVVIARGELDALSDELERLKEEAQKYQRAHTQMNLLKRKLQEVRDQPSPETRRDTLRAKLLQYAKTRVQAVTDINDLLVSAGDESAELANSVLIGLQATANVKAVDEVLDLGKQRVEDLNAARLEAKQQEASWRHKMEATYERLREMANEAGNEVAAKLKENIRDIKVAEDKEATIASLEDHLADVEAQLDLSVGVSANVIDRHRRLSAELAAKQKEVDKQQREVTAITTKINALLGKFNPALEALVSVVSDRFSAAFQRIGCSGEVRIRRVEGDFAEWGLEIAVSYRDNQPLEILTAGRQSGGEKSLATITYLMSLSEVSHTPFSLVDEINQGMDARAERNMHNQLVRVTCSDAAGQYFLITPKLLTDLDYHPLMKVLIVNNGTWIPDAADRNQRFGSLAKCLAKYKRSHPIAAAA